MWLYAKVIPKNLWLGIYTLIWVHKDTHTYTHRVQPQLSQPSFPLSSSPAKTSKLAHLHHGWKNKASQNAGPSRFPSRPKGGEGLGTGRGNLAESNGFSCRRELFEESWGMLACEESMRGVDLLTRIRRIECTHHSEIPFSL